MAGPDVFMWTLTTCPWCRKAKQWFNARGVDYDFVDMDTLSDAQYEASLAEMRALTEARSFPIVRIGDAIVVGFVPEKYAAALGIEG